METTYEKNPKLSYESFVRKNQKYLLIGTKIKIIYRRIFTRTKALIVNTKLNIKYFYAVHFSKTKTAIKLKNNSGILFFDIDAVKLLSGILTIDEYYELNPSKYREKKRKEYSHELKEVKKFYKN